MIGKNGITNPAEKLTAIIKHRSIIRAGITDPLNATLISAIDMLIKRSAVTVILTIIIGDRHPAEM
jgi:hypothetical protein